MKYTVKLELEMTIQIEADHYTQEEAEEIALEACRMAGESGERSWQALSCGTGTRSRRLRMTRTTARILTTRRNGCWISTHPFRWDCWGCLVPSRRERLEKELDELENARQSAYTDWRSRMYWHHEQASQADCDKIAEAYRAFRATDAKAHRATACLHDCACPLK